MILTAESIANFVQQPLIGGNINAQTPINRVVTDTRQLQAGDFFVAIKGQQTDGHLFVENAFAKGALGAMVANTFAKQHPNLVQVPDTRLGLGLLAKAWRLAHTVKIIGITGSNGKTTTKEMLLSILHKRVGPDAVLATPGNFNNDIGLPLTLLGLNDRHRYAIIEMGMNHSGEIAYLTDLTSPDIAVVLNALRAHLGDNFSGTQDIAKAKAEIFEGLPLNGTAIINAEDPHASLWAKAADSKQVIYFGLQQGDVIAEAISLHKTHTDFVLKALQGQKAIALNLPGMHNIKNALAATAAGLAAGVSLDGIAQGLCAFNGTAGRLCYRQARCGATLIDDTYNANPDSMKAAIDVLALSKEPTLLVMGDMAELGHKAPMLHDEVGRYAKACGINQLFTLGTLSEHAADAFGSDAQSFQTIDSLLKALDGLLHQDMTVLVKGSRFMKMERVIEHLIGRTTN